MKNQDYLLNVQQHYSKHVLSLSSNERVVVYNGRIIGPFDNDEEFTSEDFSLLERFSQSTYGDKLFKYLMKDQLFDDDEYGKLIQEINKYYICILLITSINIYIIYFDFNF